MIISYHILFLSIFTLSQVSEFSVINSTSTDYTNINGSGKPPINEADNSKIEDILKKEKQLVNSSNSPDSDLIKNDVNERESHSSDVPILSNNITVDDVKPAVDGAKTEPIRPPETEITDKDDPILSANITQTKSNSDEMPTFDEYRQKLEKESKQKREKADSIPSSPTMITKDNTVVKPVETINSQPLTKENIEPIRSGSSISPPNNGQDTNNQNIEKVELKIRQIPLATEDLKLDARTATLTKKLLKNNVAAKECGAKMLEFSGQITNADFVLNNNKDEYLNVPCSITEKWFIIETCEPVQIRSIQIANFEMFSSRPKTFKVYSSDRYPVKHWYNLGLFRAHDEKGVQTFTISDSNMVKYIKFEMVDHYGNEHYCPLTFVRILGNVVIDEIDEEAEDNQQSLDEDAPVDKSEYKINNDGILTKAKDILVKMVNGIGGTKKSDESFEFMSNTVNKFDENNSNLIVTESPCYFIDFLTKITHLNCDIIYNSFQRLVESEKYLSCDSKGTLENQIISEPFPFQIRVNYFTLYQFLYNTHFEFPKLHRSFLNLTLHSKDLCIQNHWQNLSSIFKCNLILNRNSKFDEPRLPNITGGSECSKTVPTTSSSTVDIPNTPTFDHNNKDIPPPQIPGQIEPINGNSQTKGSSISSYPLPSNDTKIEEQNHQDKNSTVENSNHKDQKSDKVVNHQIKELEFESNDILSSADNQNKIINSGKSKPEDITTDQKFLASPGSNAWNQAFMRIKNMAKQLEVNVSISMKYLEELSQNYKQQTERLKKAQSSMSENVTNLELIIHQHRQETQKSIQDLNSQLQNLILKIKYSFSLRNHLKSKSKSGFNLSDSLEHEKKCVELLDDDLFVGSWWWWLESPLITTFTNVILSVLCNLIFVGMFYNRLKNKIIADIQSSQILSAKYNSHPHPNPHSHEFSSSYMEELPIFSPSRSCTDLTNSQHPVVLPPRGVNFSFYNSDSVLNTGLDAGFVKRNQSKIELGPHFYAVQPNLNFVTPSKDRKKKRKK